MTEYAEGGSVYPAAANEDLIPVFISPGCPGFMIPEDLVRKYGVPVGIDDEAETP